MVMIMKNDDIDEDDDGDNASNFLSSEYAASTLLLKAFGAIFQRNEHSVFKLKGKKPPFPNICFNVPSNNKGIQAAANNLKDFHGTGKEKTAVVFQKI